MVHQCNASVDLTPNNRVPYPPNMNEKTLYEQFKIVIGDMLGEDAVMDAAPLMGAEDFSFYGQIIPSHFFFLGMQDEAGSYQSFHSSYYRLNEDVLPYGAAMHPSLAVRYLKEKASKGPVSPDEL